MKSQIIIDDFSKIELKVGEVINTEEVPGSEKLVKLTVDFKDYTRIIFAGIKKWYNPQNLIGRKFIFVVNLAPKTLKINNVEYISEGMLVAAGDNEAVLYNFDKEIENGTTIH